MSNTSTALLSNDFIYASMALYTLAFFAHAVEVAWSVKTPAKSVKKTRLDFSRTERVGRLASAFMVLGFLLLTVGVVLRGISANRVPWGNMYEFSITGALAFSGAYLFALKKYKLRWLGLPVSLAVLLTLGTAITRSRIKINLVSNTRFSSNHLWRSISVSKCYCWRLFNFRSL